MDFFAFISLVGSAAFALSGYLVGARKGLDIMGLFIVAMLTANGGGALRDVLLGHTPAVLGDVQAFSLVCAVLIIAGLFKIHQNEKIDNAISFVVSDSAGLVAFAITGALMGIEAGLSLFGVMVLGFVTATGGGILRDVLVNEMPTMLKSDIYGSVALGAAALLFALDRAGLTGPIWMALVFILGLTVRLVAYRFGWKLPRIEV
jgi:uncharacterized membrane protein YeiH